MCFCHFAHCLLYICILIFCCLCPVTVILLHCGASVTVTNSSYVCKHTWPIKLILIRIGNFSKPKETLQYRYTSERKKRISESVHTNERIDSLNESNFSSLLWQRPRRLAVVGRADAPPRVSVQQLTGREAVRIGHSQRSVSSLSLAHCALRTPKAVKFITYSFIGKYKQTFYFTLSCFIPNIQAEMHSRRPVCRNNNSDFLIIRGWW